MGIVFDRYIDEVQRRSRQAAGLFGPGIYLADDPGKSDQYAVSLKEQRVTPYPSFFSELAESWNAEVASWNASQGEGGLPDPASLVLEVPYSGRQAHYYDYADRHAPCSSTRTMKNRIVCVMELAT